MQFSEQWLRGFVNPALDTSQLAELLTMAGLEVEELAPVAPSFSGIVVARILSTEAHPNADKLRVCRVDAGQDEPLQIVCGAPNAAAGMKVPCALVGAQLPGLQIKAAKLRGVESFGMLCSARELGVSDEQGGLLALPAEAPVGEDVRQYLGLDDVCFTIKLTPNRADCLSLLGIAREVSALTRTPFHPPIIAAVPPVHDGQRPIVLDAPDACPRYCGRVVSGVNAKAPTPEWMVRRLARSGIRSISALVDITNYVMLELGQPLHAFDNGRLEGAIHVRFPRPCEQVLLLNGQVVEPAADTLLIADEARALALAGIMGGEESGITLDTTELFLESAFFAPDAVAGRARALGFASDASYRFERGVDFDGARRAMERATQLVMEICGGVAGPVTEAVEAGHLPARRPIRLRPARVQRVLGIALEPDAIGALLGTLALRCERDGEDFVVTPPSYRFDLEIEEDLIEEVARLHGYDNIPAAPPQAPLAMLPLPEGRRSSGAVRHELAAREYQEVVTYAFVDAGWESDFCRNAAPIRLANPIASQMSVMRSSLIGGLVGALVANRNRQIARARMFELGRCFLSDPQAQPVPGFRQPLKVAALAAGPAAAEQWGVATRNADFFDVKADVEALLAPRVARYERTEHPALHPGRAAAVVLEGEIIGVLGELHPRWVQKYELGAPPVVFELDLEAVLVRPQPQCAEISRFPAVVQDLALVVPRELPVQSLVDGLKAAAPAIVKGIEIFDLYQGKGIEPGEKSVAIRVVMQDTERTLADAEVEAARTRLIQIAETSFSAKLR